VVPASCNTWKSHNDIDVMGSGRDRINKRSTAVCCTIVHTVSKYLFVLCMCIDIHDDLYKWSFQNVKCKVRIIIIICVYKRTCKHVSLQLATYSSVHVDTPHNAHNACIHGCRV
jgi:hypothetical protein